jgi:hypothetical protein
MEKDSKVVLDLWEYNRLRDFEKDTNNKVRESELYKKYKTLLEEHSNLINEYYKLKEEKKRKWWQL